MPCVVCLLLLLLLGLDTHRQTLWQEGKPNRLGSQPTLTVHHPPYPTRVCTYAHSGGAALTAKAVARTHGLTQRLANSLFGHANLEDGCPFEELLPMFYPKASVPPLPPSLLPLPQP